MHDPLTVAWEIGPFTIWHHDPSDYDSNDRCPYSGRWRWHVHHWRIQWHTYQRLRRTLLTRCEWCGGTSRKGGRVNCGKGWHSEKSPWWRGEVGLYHSECLSAEGAWNCCTCARPVLGFYDAGHAREYGECQACGRWRVYGQRPGQARWAEAMRREVARGERPSGEALAKASAFR